jgi:hypothetical protein
VAKHGEPATLKAVTGSGGFHYYFSRSGTIGLNKRNNFSGLRVDGTLFGIDGRGVGGLLFALPSQYKGKRGEIRVILGHPEAMGYQNQCPHSL